MTLGNRIQTLRKRQGLSQEALAEQLGVSRQAIGKWESGGSVPSIENLLELSSILNTTVDHLLTGKETDSVPESAEEKPGETVSLDALQKLMEQQQAHRPVNRGLVIFCAVVVLFLVWMYMDYHREVEYFQRTLTNLDAAVDNLSFYHKADVDALSQEIEDALQQQISILSAADTAVGEYDAETNTAVYRMSATPKLLTEDTKLYFVLSPMTSSRDTLEEPITVPGTVSAGTYTAETAVPMVRDFVVSVVVQQNGVRQTETIREECDFSEIYICSMWASGEGFSWTLSGGKVTFSGTASCTVRPPKTEFGPRPETLLCRLYLNGQVVDEVEYPVYEEFGGGSESGVTENAAPAAVEVTYYPGPDVDMSREGYPCEGEPRVKWVFTLTDTAGNIYEETIEWE